VLAQIFAEPSDTSQVIGYMRRGARFRAVRVKGRCNGGNFYELSTGGFVCTGRGFLIGTTPQTFDPVPPPASFYDPLPYAYAKNNARHELQYWRMPSVAEQRQAVDLVAAAAAAAAAAPPPTPAKPVATPAPALVSAALALPETDPASELALPDYARMAMEPGFYVSVDRTELADDAGAPRAAPEACLAAAQDAASAAACTEPGRPFARTVRGAYVPLASLTDVRVDRAPGVVLDAATPLPLAIVYRGSAKTLVRDADTGALAPGDKLERYAHVALTGARVQQGSLSYYMSRAGRLIAEPNLRVVQRGPRPPLVPRGARWIHVSLADQTLVAYEGDRPVFATLVATGKEGYATPTGLFRIYAKHVSATMDGMAGSDEAYSIEDVPWTMYFQGSYALHAAFWHDRFGAVHSHGCINLSPADAHWLFRWTTPVLPASWHGVSTTKDNAGTFVVIE
jgi:hypothetical protein